MLVDFVREVYGEYMETHRDKLLHYVFKNDRNLYNAIISYRKTYDNLPEDIKMPTEGEKLAAKMQKVAVHGLVGLTRAERHLIYQKIKRDAVKAGKLARKPTPS